MTMTIAVAVAVVLALGAGVAWALARFLHEVARYSDWDEPIVKAKRKGWR
jgi:MFS superfamily sulfate permease-like transporter